MTDIYLPDADFLLEQLAERPEREDRDHLAELAAAHALTSVAHSLAEIRDFLLQCRDHGIQVINLNRQSVDVSDGFADDTTKGDIPVGAGVGNAVARGVDKGLGKGRQFGVGVKFGHEPSSSSVAGAPEGTARESACPGFCVVREGGA